jgi:hypothetical protein
MRLPSITAFLKQDDEPIRETVWPQAVAEQVSSDWMFGVCLSTRNQTKETGQKVNSVHSHSNIGARKLSRLRPGHQEGVRQSACRVLRNRVARVKPDQEEQS